MSTHKICDCCHKIIYDEKERVILDIRTRNRYDREEKIHLVDLCKGCDLKVAKSLIKILPSIAYHIEPNVKSIDDPEI